MTGTGAVAATQVIRAGAGAGAGVGAGVIALRGNAGDGGIVTSLQPSGDANTTNPSPAPDPAPSPAPTRQNRASMLPGSSYFPLPIRHRIREGQAEVEMDGTTEEEVGEEEIMDPEEMAVIGSTQTAGPRTQPREGGRDMDQVKRLAALYAQPSEWPPQTAEERTAGAELGMAWVANIGTVTRARPEEDGTDNRRRTRYVPTQDESTRVWHSLTARPEQFFPSQLPEVGANTYMRRLVHDTSTSFVPALFCLYPEAHQAIRKRDAWIRSRRR